MPRKNSAIAAACALCVGLTASYEGLRTKPYRDVTGKPTVCYGETERAMRSYTADECAVMLSARERKDYAPAVLKCVPAIGSRAHVFAASIDASYNAGIGAFCRSPMARKFNAGDWAGGCAAFSGWYVKANGKLLTGLVRRRAAERALCEREAA